MTTRKKLWETDYDWEMIPRCKEKLIMMKGKQICDIIAITVCYRSVDHAIQDFSEYENFDPGHMIARIPSIIHLSFTEGGLAFENIEVTLNLMLHFAPSDSLFESMSNAELIATYLPFSARKQPQFAPDYITAALGTRIERLEVLQAFPYASLQEPAERMAALRLGLSSGKELAMGVVQSLHMFPGEGYGFWILDGEDVDKSQIESVETIF